MATTFINPLKDKILSKEWVMSYVTLIAGTFVLALGYAFFMTPYKITREVLRHLHGTSLSI